jgi:hypothetical protein
MSLAFFKINEQKELALEILQYAYISVLVQGTPDI